MKTYNVCDDGILRQVADGDIGFWVKTIDYENALSAKDARIAKLEGLLRAAWPMLNGATGDFHCRIQEVLAGQHQAEPVIVHAVDFGVSEENPDNTAALQAAIDFCGKLAATPSEDGREVGPYAGDGYGVSLRFGYTNWRGEYAERNAVPLRVYFGSTEWHPEPQWLMEAYDRDKKEKRVFALKDMGTQHSRIVAAKDADIARLRDAADKGNAARLQCVGMEMEIAELRALLAND